jgi:hypothetical protein
VNAQPPDQDRTVSVFFCAVSANPNALRRLQLRFVAVYADTNRPVCGPGECGNVTTVGNLAPLYGRSRTMPAHAIQMQADVRVSADTATRTAPITLTLVALDLIEFCGSPDPSSC